MKNHKFVLSRNATKTWYTTEEATEILKAFGLASSVQSTQRYIRKGYLKATPTVSSKTSRVDRREGYDISEPTLYSFIAERVPGVKELWDLINDKTSTKGNKAKTK